MGSLTRGAIFVYYITFLHILKVVNVLFARSVFCNLFRLLLIDVLDS
jgi:hypothetical protein